MSEATQGPISLTSQLFTRPGSEKQVQEAVKNRGRRRTEKARQPNLPDAHASAETGLSQSLHPPAAPSLPFFETYGDADAFKAHFPGTLFNEFVNQYGHCFIPSDPIPNNPSSKAGPYTTLQFLTRVAGFAHSQPPEES